MTLFKVARWVVVAIIETRGRRRQKVMTPPAGDARKQLDEFEARKICMEMPVNPLAVDDVVCLSRLSGTRGLCKGT